MAQLNLYVTDKVAARLKREARRAGVPLSRYVVSRLEDGAEHDWPAGFFQKACGFLREKISEPGDRLPEAVELPESLR